MLVYVITQGSYSDYHICEVTLDKDKAEKLAKFYTNGYDEAQIEEFDTEEVEHEELDRLIPVYIVRISGKGETSISIHHYHDGAKPYNPEYVFPDRHDPLRFVAKLTAKDEHHAIKTARDQRAKMIALAYGL